jgi:hypothetical protein
MFSVPSSGVAAPAPLRRKVWKGSVAATPEDGTENMPKHVVCNFNI